jgi:hypothetical protein
MPQALIFRGKYVELGDEELRQVPRKTRIFSPDRSHSGLELFPAPYGRGRLL